VHRLLDLFDSIELPAVENVPKDQGNTDTINNEYKHKYGLQTTGYGNNRRVHATFFILGWIAEKLPGLVREIAARGHEIASHGNNHELCSRLDPEQFRIDLTESKKKLEDMIDREVAGYRAPSFSIDNESLLQIMEAGFLYDSSWNSFNLHNRYGQAALSCIGNSCIPLQLAERFYELPISNLKIPTAPRFLQSLSKTDHALVLPLGGGGYFRLIPHRMFRMGVKKILKETKAYIFYIHPWEIDPSQPRVASARWFYRFRHYTNIDKTYDRLSRLILFFRNCQFLTCSDFIRFRKGVEFL
jgi:polysaccharide deacetylase family protein (PEP-CTERM system associated)